MAKIYAYTSNNIYCEYTMSIARSGTTVTLTVSGTIYGNGSSSDSTSGQALYVQVRTGVSPTNTSGTTTYVSDYGTLLSWSSTTTVTGYTGTNSNCMIASNTTSNNLPPLNKTGFPTSGRAFTVTYTTTNGGAVSLDDVALFIFKSKTATTAPSNGAYTFIGKKSSSLSGNQIRYVTQDLSVAATTYTVSYNKGTNGTGTNTTATKTHGVALTLKGAIFTRSGYYQSGWATSDGGSQAYALSASYTANAAVTLYPVWTAYQLTVQYNANGGTITTGTGTTRFRVSSNIVQRSTDSGSTWSNLTATGTIETTEINLHNITSTSGTYDSGVLRTGYHVVNNAEFNTKADGTGNDIAEDTGSTNPATVYRINGNANLTADKTITLYVKWVKDTYTISYNANGHGTAPSSQTKTYGTALTLQSFISNVNGTTSTVTITGDNTNGDSWSGSNGSATWRPVYSQNSWNTKSDGSGTSYGSAASYTANAAATMYAQWTTTNTGLTYVLPTGTPVKNNTTTNTLTVSYNANGGSSTPSSQTSSKTVTYSFKGWYTAASGGTQRTTSSRVIAAETVYSQFNSTTGSQAAITLRAGITHSNTTPSTYTVTFNANGGSTTKSSQNANVTRTYSFNGWHEGSASGTSHAASSSFTPSANVTMYAGWDTSDSTASVTLPTTAQCTRAGYTLLGFATSDTATTATYLPGATYTPTATIILYAIWERNNVVKIYHNGSWVLAPSYIYINGEWKAFSNIKVYNGSSWEDV